MTLIFLKDLIDGRIVIPDRKEMLKLLEVDQEKESTLHSFDEKVKFQV